MQLSRKRKRNQRLRRWVELHKVVGVVHSLASLMLVDWPDFIKKLFLCLVLG